MHTHVSSKAPQDRTAVDLDNPQVFLAWQRNHLANQRTFLAWCRTGLSLFVFGFVIERFDFFMREMRGSPVLQAVAPSGHPHADWLGMLCVAAGMLVVLLAAWRYWRVRQAIDSGIREFPIWPELALVAVLLGIITGLLAMFWILLAR